MGHETFSDIGIELVKEGWGTGKGTANINELIRNMSDSRLTVCLLAAAVKQLAEANNQLRSMKSILKEQSMALARASGDTPIHELDMSTLSVRAKNILFSSGLKLRSEITPTNLKKVRQCGPVTISELMKWVDSLNSKDKPKHPPMFGEQTALIVIDRPKSLDAHE